MLLTHMMDHVNQNDWNWIDVVADGLAGEKTSLFEITVYVNQRKLGTKLVKYEYQTKTEEEDVIQKMAKVMDPLIVLI